MDWQPAVITRIRCRNPRQRTFPIRTRRCGLLLLVAILASLALATIAMPVSMSIAQQGTPHALPVDCPWEAAATREAGIGQGRCHSGVDAIDEVVRGEAERLLTSSADVLSSASVADPGRPRPVAGLSLLGQNRLATTGSSSVLPLVVAGVLLALASSALAVAVRGPKVDSVVVAGVWQGALGDGERWIKTVAEVVAVCAVVFTVTQIMGALVVKPFSVSNNSMVPTLAVGEQILVERLSTRLGGPDRGDIVVFSPPAGAANNTCGVRHLVGQACARPTPARLDALFIKRVVASPGDRLKVLHGVVHINGQPQRFSNKHPDAVACEMCTLPMDITVPPGHFFVMGDNRARSDDSRRWGPIPRDWLVGRMFFTYWPPSRLGPP